MCLANFSIALLVQLLTFRLCLILQIKLRIKIIQLCPLGLGNYKFIYIYFLYFYNYKKAPHFFYLPYFPEITNESCLVTKCLIDKLMCRRYFPTWINFLHLTNRAIVAYGKKSFSGFIFHFLVFVIILKH